ncbi:hypothetical protein EMIT0232MI5_50312 [Pseudomonas sp. IT-232MI5]
MAPKFFHCGGTKLSNVIFRLLLKVENESAIKLRLVPSLTIFQEISDFAMSGQELRPNA